MIVYIIATVKSPDKITTGGTLVFESIRTGFPGARVVVYDNASIPDASRALMKAARRNDCAYIYNDTERRHGDIIRSRVMAKSGPIAFIDPDIMFWEDCSDITTNKLFIGRFIPGYREEYTHSFTMPRIHPSFLLIPSAEKLRKKIQILEGLRWRYDPFVEYVFPLKGAWYRFDTLANLTASFPDSFDAFTSDILNRYDHLFSGSMPDIADSLSKEASLNYTSWVEAINSGKYKELRGIWRQQEAFFQTQQKVTGQ